MGLLSHVTSTFKSQDSSAFSLFEFSKKFKIRKCALYSLVFEKMVMTDCTGFDTVTISKSVSPVDFWNEIVKTESKWVSFKKDEINKFSQFFSENDLKKVDALHFFRISNEVVFMAVQTIGDIFYLPDAEDVMKLPSAYSPVKIDDVLEAEKKKLNVDSEMTLLVVSLNHAIDASTEKNLDSELRKIVERTICREVYYRLSDSCTAPNKAFDAGGGEIKLLISSLSAIDETLFQFHLAHSVEDIFGNFSSSVAVIKYKTSAVAQEIQSFL